MANQRIKANLIPSCDIYPVIHLAQYDVSDGTWKQVEIELYYGTDKFTIPSGSSITFRGTKRDKTGYSYEITKFTDNVVTVDVKPQMTVLLCGIENFKGEYNFKYNQVCDENRQFSIG